MGMGAAMSTLKGVPVKASATAAPNWVLNHRIPSCSDMLATLATLESDGLPIVHPASTRGTLAPDHCLGWVAGGSNFSSLPRPPQAAMARKIGSAAPPNPANEPTSGR